MLLLGKCPVFTSFGLAIALIGTAADVIWLPSTEIPRQHGCTLATTCLIGEGVQRYPASKGTSGYYTVTTALGAPPPDDPVEVLPYFVKLRNRFRGVKLALGSRQM
eukprot:3741238-Amphidinium_carterae.1